MGSGLSVYDSSGSRLGAFGGLFASTSIGVIVADGTLIQVNQADGKFGGTFCEYSLAGCAGSCVVGQNLDTWVSYEKIVASDVVGYRKSSGLNLGSFARNSAYLATSGCVASSTTDSVSYSTVSYTMPLTGMRPVRWTVR